MLGGNNPHKYTADCESLYFYIDGGTNNIYYDWANNPKESSKCLFTLEEFEEKFPYKVGDKVSSKYLKNYEIEKIEWEGCNNRVIYKLQGMGWYNVNELQPYKEETMEERQYKELRMPLDDDDKLATEVTIDGNKIQPPNGYLIGKITQVNNGFLVEYVKKQPQFQKTHEECCEVLGKTKAYQSVSGYKTELLEDFQKLLICRDAYWKIAGNQMGLGKPWKPDWSSSNSIKFILYICENEIRTGISLINNHILAFPTEEMRDAFYENFKELIENCKELL